MSSATTRASGRPTVAVPIADRAPEPANPGSKAAIEAFLADTRERTLLLIGPLSDQDIAVQHDPLMSPIVWDLGHIAGFEDLWLVQHMERPFEGLASLGEMPGVFNPFEHPRKTRGELALPTRDEVLTVLGEVRERTLARLQSVDCGPDAPPLTRDGYVYHMVAQHEAQHGETMLQTLQLKQGEPYHPPERRTPPEGAAPAGTMARFPGGRAIVGTDDRRAAYDNERGAHPVDLAPFDIDVTPVTNAAYLEFMAAGGYHSPEWWSSAGREWLAESRAVAPLYWHRHGGQWWTRTMDRSGPVDPTHPVVHVCHFEAEAFARWAGKRLPTEAEWEAAATWDPHRGVKRLWPWGDAPWTETAANLDQLTFGTSAVGAYQDNMSPIGCYGMIGDVWEWTASEFRPYPGYATFPYREYSEVFFGPEYKVLRGGSWATRAFVGRSTFRNWDYPIRRQIFSGFRCARDA